MTMTMLSQTEAQRELCELNALHLEQALLQARIAAATTRLIETGTTRTVRWFDGDRMALLPGSRIHVLREVWTDSRRDKFTTHDADSCTYRWCSNPIGEVLVAERATRHRPGIGFAFEGSWIFAAHADDSLVLVREEVYA